jgi:hypothetical protein
MEDTTLLVCVCEYPARGPCETDLVSEFFTRATGLFYKTTGVKVSNGSDAN